MVLLIALDTTIASNFAIGKRAFISRTMLDSPLSTTLQIVRVLFHNPEDRVLITYFHWDNVKRDEGVNILWLKCDESQSRIFLSCAHPKAALWKNHLL